MSRRGADEGWLAAMRVTCCDAGRIAVPDPCPWHGPAKSTASDPPQEDDDWGHPVLRFALIRLHYPQDVRWRVRLGHLDDEPGNPLCLGVLTPWLMVHWQWFR